MPRLGCITKRGDRYLCTLLVHGAGSEMICTAGKLDAMSRWAESLRARKGRNKACVALANKHASIAWAMLAKERTFHPACDGAW